MQQALPLAPGSTGGRSLADLLARRHPGEDWIAALAKGAVMSRPDVEAILASDDPAPPAILEAASSLEAMLQPPDPYGQDDIFEARTNDDQAVMEVDGEAGLTNVPSSKPHPSRSNSRHEMGERKEDCQNDGI